MDDISLHIYLNSAFVTQTQANALLEIQTVQLQSKSELRWIHSEPLGSGLQHAKSGMWPLPQVESSVRAVLMKLNQL